MPRPLRQALNQALTNNQVDAMRGIRSGDAFEQSGMFISGGQGDFTGFALPEAAKASAILTAFATTGTPGFLTVVNGTPAAGEIAVSPTGDIALNIADSITNVELVYMPQEGAIFEDLVDVAASVSTLLQSRGGVILLEAEVLTGVIPGVKAVIARASAATASSASLDAAGTGITWDITDVVVGTARIKYYATPGVGGQPLPLVNRLNDDQGAI